MGGITAEETAAFVSFIVSNILFFSALTGSVDLYSGE